MPETTAHPSQEQLSAYNLGQLPPDEAVAIESHISECEPCCDTIISLSSDDTFVGLLKEARQLPTDQTVDHDVPTASSTCEDVPTQLAEHSRYEIVRLIGKGGMGDVYEARHRKMERTVALKVINRDLVRQPEAVDRFHREVKTAAQLSHPNIVTAFDADQAGDFHFMVMEYVDGVDLAATVKNGGALPIAKACDAIRQAAIGLQYAHEQGMVHRDIKPHNLMMTQGGTVKILDFGLASLAPKVQPDAETLHAQSDLTAAGSIMGTPDFISPEQAEDARQVDIRSDIYSLGTTLYYLLSGRPPFHDGSVMAKLKSHATEEPTQLDGLRDDVPEGLAALVARMIAKDRNERFQTPAEVAESLLPFVQEQPQSRAQSAAEAPQNLSRRLWPIRAIVTALVVAIIGGGAFWGVNQVLKEQDAKRAKAAYRQADAFLESEKNIGFIQDPLPLRNVIAPLIAELQSSKTDGAEYLRRLDYDHKTFVYEKGSGFCLFVIGNKVYVKSPRVGSAVDGMEFNTSHFKSIKKKDDKILMNLAVADTQQAKDVCKKYGVEYSPTLEVKIGFDTLISAPSNLGTLLKDEKASVVAATTEKLSAIALVNGCEVSGRFTAEQAEVTVHNPTKEPRDVSFHCQIIYQNSRNRSDIFQLKAGEFKATVAPGRSTVKRFDRMVDPNAGLPANYLKDLLVLRVSRERLDTTRDYPIVPDKKLDLAKQPVTITLWPSGVSPAAIKKLDGLGRKFIPEGLPPVRQPAGDATSDSGNAASELAVQPAIVLGSAPFRFGGRVSSLEYSPDGKRLLSAGGMWGAALWDADTGELVRHFTGGNAWTVADFSADGRYLGIAGYSQGTALIWDAHTGKQVCAIKKSKTAVRFAPDGKSVFTEFGNKLKRFDIATGERLPGFTSDLSQYWSFATPQVGTLVAGLTPRGNLYVWDWKTGKEIAQTTKIHSGIHNAKDIVFTGDGQSLVVFGKHLSNTIELRAARTLEVTRTFKTRRGPRSLNISRDGKRLAVGCDLGWVQVFDLATGESIMGCEGHTATDSVSAVALSPDGKRLACGTDMSGAIRIWDVATAKELSPGSEGHSATIGEVAVLKDGTVLSQDYDRAFGRWDPETRKSTHFWNWPGPLEFPTEWALCSETGRALSGYNSLLLTTDPTDPKAFVDVYEKAKPPTERGRKGSEVFGSKTRINAVALSADGRRAAAAHINDRVVVCDLEGFKYVRTFTLPKVQHLAWDRQYSLALSPDGRLLAGSSQNKAALWEVETGTELDLPEIEFGLSRLAFSPDGKALALASLYEVVICSVRDGKVLRRLVDRKRGVRAIAFSPDSKLLATGGMEFTDTVTLWDIATGQQVSRLVGARGGAQSLEFSHDGNKLYAGTGSSLVIGWDLEKALTTGSDGKSSAARKGPRFQLHFVEPRHIEGVTGPGIKFDTGAKDPLVYMHIKPALVLQPSHVASIKMRSFSFAGSPCYSIDIELTDAARKQLAAVVEGKGDHMRHVTYVVDGKRRGGWQRYEINVAKPGGIPEICRADTFCPLFTANGKNEEEYVQQIVNALKPEESTSAPAPSEKATKTPTQEN